MAKEFMLAFTLFKTIEVVTSLSLTGEEEALLTISFLKKKQERHGYFFASTI